MAALAENRPLQTVGDEALDFLAKNARDLANRLIESDGVRNSTWVQFVLPGTISTSGIRCGGLNGCPIRRRRGSFILTDCSVAVFAELEESSSACAGTMLLDAGPQSCLNSTRSGPFSCTRSAPATARSSRPRSAVSFVRFWVEARGLERWRGFANVTIHDRFNVIARIVDDDRKTVRKKNRRPRGSDDACADDGNF